MAWSHSFLSSSHLDPAIRKLNSVCAGEDTGPVAGERVIGGQWALIAVSRHESGVFDVFLRE